MRQPVQPVSTPTFFAEQQPEGQQQPPPEVGGFRVTRPAGRRDGGTLVFDAVGKDGRPATLHVSAAVVDSRRERARFRRLARERARLEHPAVLPVESFGEERGRLFVATEPLPAGSLADLVRDGPLEPAEAIRILTAAAGALDAARERDLVHRGLSPESVLLEGDRVVLDLFGIVGASGAAGVGEVAPRGAHIHYKPPECVRGEEAQAPANVYSLAAILVHALTGKPPYEHSDPVLIEYAHLSEPPPRPSRRMSGLPAGLDGLVARAMAKEPWRRPATAGALMDEARRILLGGTNDVAAKPAASGATTSTNGHHGSGASRTAGAAPAGNRPSTVSPVLEAWIAAGSMPSPSASADAPVAPPAAPARPAPGRAPDAAPAGGPQAPRPAARPAPPLAPPLRARVRALLPLAAAVVVAAAFGVLVGTPGDAPDAGPTTVRPPDAAAVGRFDAVRLRLRDDLALAASAEEQARLADRLAVAHDELATRAGSGAIDAAAEDGSAAYAELAAAARDGDADGFDAAGADVEAAEAALERAVAAP